MPKITLIRLFAALLLSLSALAAHATVPLPDAVSADPQFAFSTEQDLWVDLWVYDIDGAPADLRMVEILEGTDAQGHGTRLIEKGLTDAAGGFQGKIRVSRTTTEVTIRVGVMGISNTVTLSLDGSGTVSHAFE